MACPVPAAGQLSVSGCQLEPCLSLISANSSCCKTKSHANPNLTKRIVLMFISARWGKESWKRDVINCAEGSMVERDRDR